MKLRNAGIALIIILTWCCSPKNDRQRYRDLLHAQLNSGIIQDQLFLEIRFGESRADFFQYCWKMNAKKIFFNASGNQDVLFKMDSAFKSVVNWKFFPDFKNERISKLTAQLSYDAFAPWNAALSADSLLKDLIGVFGHWYGDDHFMVLKESGNRKKLIKIDANRQIAVWKLNEKDIQVEYTDMSVSDDKLLSYGK